MLRHMRPRLAMHKRQHGFLRHAVACAGSPCRHAASDQCANRAHRFWIKFRAAVGGATNIVGVIVSALRDHVQHVIARCAKEQMCRVAAFSYVACVAYKQAGRNRAVCLFPRKAMGILAWFRAAVWPECAIASCATSTPQPAIVRPTLVNLRREVACNVSDTRWHPAILANGSSI